uniref:Zgc:193801 n=1 Tax=Astyanax mexicanus TaxID=7994 RepID=A0A3B1J610_ASTMX
MAMFVAHPSVRIRGTEHTYSPVLCQDEKCDGCEKGVHMHCPLCTAGEAYQDLIILRAHFRNKHVDKGIDFAGLKVLRCCNHCEIVGTIKGEKRFKGAHWHCYRCRNGFNRRDEAIKHYKTHFRNPHTTFQIQVTQDVNCRQYYSSSTEANVKAYSGLAVSSGGDATAAVGSIVTQPVLTTTSDTEGTTLLTVEPKEDGESNGIPLGAEEEVGSSQHASERTQTLVLMDPDGHTGSLIYDEATGILTEQSGESLEKRLLEVNQQIDTLRQEKESMEKNLRAEIKQLKEQVCSNVFYVYFIFHFFGLCCFYSIYNNGLCLFFCLFVCLFGHGKVASLVQANVKMFEELQAYQCPDHSQQRVTKLMETLQAQHKELLQAQLASLRQELLSQTTTLPLNGHTETIELSATPESSHTHVEMEVQGTIGGSLTGLEIIEVQLQSEQDELRGQLVEFGPVQAETCIPSLDSPRLDTALQDTALTTTQDMVVKQDNVLPVPRKRSSEDDCGETSENKVPRVS